MGRLKKPLVFLSLLLLLIAGAAWIHLATRVINNFESLLLCAEGSDELIPARFCQTYLFNYSAKPEDIVRLNEEGIGLAWVLHGEDLKHRDKLVAFLIERGVDIDARDRRTGITVLHAAVLENNFPVVALLVEHGADVHALDRDNGKSPLMFALERQGLPGQPDRGAIIELLSRATPARSA